MESPDPLVHLTATDRLRLVAFDLVLNRAPASLIQAIWEAVDALEEKKRGFLPSAT